jgi:OFA family oxalate/formate antiporter-like MFS transporter
MPAFAADYFGPRFAGSIYGLMLTAWGVGGIIGPILIAQVRDRTGGYGTAMYVIAAIMLVSAVLPLVVRPPRMRAGEAVAGPAVAGS